MPKTVGETRRIDGCCELHLAAGRMATFVSVLPETRLVPAVAPSKRLLTFLPAAGPSLASSAAEACVPWIRFEEVHLEYQLLFCKYDVDVHKEETGTVGRGSISYRIFLLSSYRLLFLAKQATGTDEILKPFMRSRGQNTLCL